MSLRNNQLTGEIRLEIVDLTNLERLYLNYNQLTGVIPSEVCEGNGIPYVYLYDNNLCPPNPDCLTEGEIGEQDTSNCVGSGGSGCGDEPCFNITLPYSSI